MSGGYVKQSQDTEASHGSCTNPNGCAAGTTQVASLEAAGDQSSEQFSRQNYTAFFRRRQATGRLLGWWLAHRNGCAQIIHRFNQGGVGAVEWYPAMQADNSPRKYFADTVEQIAEIALSSPQSLIDMTQWSLSKLREYLVSQKIVPSISLDWLHTLLLRFHIRWRHTKTHKDSNDPEFGPKHRRIRRLYGRRPKNGRRICVDEFGPLNLQPQPGQCLAMKGRKHVDRLRATYSRQGGVRHFLAAYDMESGHVFGQFYAQKTWHEWLTFLKWLRRRYRSGETLHVVLDNYSTHLKDEVFNGPRRIRSNCTSCPPTPPGSTASRASSRRCGSLP